LLTLGSGGWARMWDLASGEVKWTEDGMTPRSAAGALHHLSTSVPFSPDGNSFLTLGSSVAWAAGAFWDARTGRMREPEFRFEETRTVDLMSDGFPPKRIGLQPRKSPVRFSAAAFSPDGERLLTWQATPLPRQNVPRLWDLRTQAMLWKSDLGGVKTAAFSPDGSKIALITDRAWVGQGF